MTNGLELLPNGHLPLTQEAAAKFEMVLKKAVSFRNLMAYYRCAIMEVETKFNVLNEEFSLRFDRNPIADIQSRLKSPASITQKMVKKGIPFDEAQVEEQISDIAGIRVVCSFVDDIYMLADCLLQQDDVRLLRKKDYIKNPKENGYRSLHLIIETPIFLANEKRMMKVEVQLRTIAMEFWANLEHQLKYKKNLNACDEITAELRECAEESAALDEKMQGIRKKLEAERSEK